MLMRPLHPCSVDGSLLLSYTARPLTLQQWQVIDYNTAFWSLTVSLNILCTVLIASRLWYQHLRVRGLGASAESLYASVIAVTVESAALYSLCGVIYIPLVVRKDTLQYPFSALMGGLTVRLHAHF